MSCLRVFHISGTKLTARFTPCEEGYLAECLEIDVITQGRTLDEALERLKEAVWFHLEAFGGD